MPENLRPECLPCSRSSGYRLARQLVRERKAESLAAATESTRLGTPQSPTLATEFGGRIPFPHNGSRGGFSESGGSPGDLSDSRYPPVTTPDPPNSLAMNGDSGGEFAYVPTVFEQSAADPLDSVWEEAPWLTSLRSIPDDASWPRLMTGPHPRAVGSWGEELAEFAEDFDGRPLRWWQRLVAARLLEYDSDEKLVWLVALLSTSRQVGKSWLLRSLAMWRIHQAEFFGEEQLAIFTGKDLPVCREIQRPARTWAKQHRHDGYGVRETNGQEEIIAPDGSRWIIRGRDSVYGYAGTLGLVDEAWHVPGSVVDEGLEPTMVEREQGQLVLTSTAHRRATSLYPSRRAAALGDVCDPSDVLLIEWSAEPGTDLDDRQAWRAASPHWTARRERLIESKLSRARSGEGDPEDADDDPLSAFRSQWLNDWSVEREERLRGRDEPLIGAEEWSAALELSAVPTFGSPVSIAVEDWYGKGSAVAVATRLPDGRILTFGETHPRRSLAARRATELAGRYPNSRLLLPASLRAAEGFPAPPVVEALVDTGTTSTREALPLLRELLAEGVLVHDGSADLAGQVIAALVVPSSAGLAMSPHSPRSDLLRCAAWAVLDVARADIRLELPAIF